MLRAADELMRAAGVSRASSTGRGRHRAGELHRHPDRARDRTRARARARRPGGGRLDASTRSQAAAGDRRPSRRGVHRGPSVGRPEELDVDGSRLVGDGAVRYRDVFEARGAVVPPDDDPAHLPAAQLLAEQAGSFGAAADVAPLYLRAPDAKPRR